MLLRIIPVSAIVLTIAALLSSPALRPHHKDGLFSPAHATGGFF